MTAEEGQAFANKERVCGGMIKGKEETKKAMEHFGTAIRKGVKCSTRKGPTLPRFESGSSREWSKAAKSCEQQAHPPLPCRLAASNKHIK